MARVRVLVILGMGLILLAGPLWSQTLDDARAAIRARDYASAVSIYEELARSGNPEAAYQLASMVRAGRGIERNPETASRWMLVAAEAGDARAQYSMGQMLQAADEPERAYEWYQKAAVQGHALAIESQAALKQNPGAVLAGMPADQRQQALIQAARQGDSERVGALLETDSEDALSGAAEETALVEAITSGATDIVDMLLRNGVDPDGQGDSAGRQGQVIPLHAAVRSESPTILSLLLDAGANTERRDEAGNTALIVAAATGSEDMVLRLLEAGSRVGPTDKRGWTALTTTRQKGHQQVARILLENGANDPVGQSSRGRASEVDITASAEGEAGWTPLMYAAWRGNRDSVEKILSRPADIDAIDQDGHTALSRAAWRGHSQIVSMLLAAEADPDAVQINGYTALLWATQDGHSEVIQLLVEAGADLDVFIPANGYSALLLACSRDDEATAEVLLKLGAAINWQSPQGESALMIAAAGDSNLLVPMLLDHNADLEVSDQHGRTASWYAVTARQQQNLALLLAAGADANARDAMNQHLLIEAVRIGDSAMVEMLLVDGVQTDVQSGSGNTALIVAASNGRTDIMLILLKHGADPDIRNEQGHSALMRTALSNQAQAAVMLLEVGANTGLVDKDHQTARDLAKESGHTGILELLQQDRN